MYDYRQAFAERLNIARKKKRISSVNFAAQLCAEVNKITPDALSHDPTHGSLTVESLYAASKMLGVSTDYLLGLSDEPKRF